MQFLSESVISRQSLCFFFFGIHTMYNSVLSSSSNQMCRYRLLCLVLLYLSLNIVHVIQLFGSYYSLSYIHICILMCTYVQTIVSWRIVIHMFGCHFQSNTSNQIDMFYYLFIDIIMATLNVCVLLYIIDNFM